MADPTGEVASLGAGVTPSHLILHVADTDTTIRFYGAVFGAQPSDDMQIASPALDAMFGRSGVRIRSTFIAAGGYRLHTIETLDQPRAAGARSAGLGLTGLSFAVADLEGFRKAALDAGFSPTEIYEFDLGDVRHNARMFFLDDPDGVRCELVEYPQQ